MEIIIDDDVIEKYHRAFFYKNGYSKPLTEDDIQEICENFLLKEYWESKEKIEGTMGNFIE